MSLYLWIIPFIGALIGWLINSGLILLFFQPRVPKVIAGIRFHGIIPKYRSTIAEYVGIYVSEKIFSFDELEQKIINPDNVTKVMPFIEGHIDEFLKVKLTKEMPFLSMFIGSKTISSLKKTFMEELMTLFPLVMKNYAGNLRNEFDIKKIVKEKIENADLQQLEFLFYKTGSKQIRNFKMLGAATGFIIGLLQFILFKILS
jgi:uncharacterized membrane protein YheB (UPF0754 family)